VALQSLIYHASPPGVPLRAGAGARAVVSAGLRRMAARGHRLPVGSAPEEGLVALVRRDVVDDGGERSVGSVAVRGAFAPRVLGEEASARLVPCGRVATLAGGDTRGGCWLARDSGDLGARRSRGHYVKCPYVSRTVPFGIRTLRRLLAPPERKRDADVPAPVDVCLLSERPDVVQHPLF
jgi:hypothetical protein